MLLALSSKFKIYINEEIKNIQLKRLVNNGARVSNVSLDKDGIYIVDVMDNNGIREEATVFTAFLTKVSTKCIGGSLPSWLYGFGGNADQLYDYAKNIYFLDFVCHSEHIDIYSSGNRHQMVQ